jgi:hypothetical protein
MENSSRAARLYTQYLRASERALRSVHLGELSREQLISAVAGVILAAKILPEELGAEVHRIATQVEALRGRAN